MNRDERALLGENDLLSVRTSWNEEKGNENNDRKGGLSRHPCGTLPKQ